jgi:hypothetical protein
MLQVAFMTGQSDPGRCALSPIQQAFLDALPVPDSGKVRTNFPYDAGTLPYREMTLALASWNNVRQYLASQSAAFAAAHRPAVLRMLGRAERTVILAGSCGLEILANLSLPQSALEHVHVFAYGPVCRHRPACEVVVVRGRRDWLARACGTRRDRMVEGGHLTYLQNPEVLARCRAVVARVAASAGVCVP